MRGFPLREGTLEELLPSKTEYEKFFDLAVIGNHRDIFCIGQNLHASARNVISMIALVHLKHIGG